MPHLVVKDIDFKQIDALPFVLWQAFDVKSKKFTLLNVGDFLLEIKKRDHDYVIRADKITKPANSERIKESLLKLSKSLNLNVLEHNVNLKNTKVQSKFLKPVSFFEDFVSDKIINVEVGFGSGRHLLYQAKENPDELFIGLEVHTTSVEQVLKQIDLQGFENLYIINYDARLFLEFLDSNSCKNIYVHFPVPWDKKPHRRVISKTFVDESMRVLQKDGILNLRTDSQNYFKYSCETIFAQNTCECKICKNQNIAISSKYEDRWKKQNKNIYDFYLKCLVQSPIKEDSYDFNFENELKLECDFKSHKFEDYFIHFENIFEINFDSYLLKVSFGSFDKPENRYIFIKSNKAQYMFEKPVKTKANYKAHQKIAEMLAWQM